MEANSKRFLKDAIRRKFLTYFGIHPSKNYEEYHQTFTRRIETFGVLAKARTQSSDFTNSSISELKLSETELTFEVDVKTGEEGLRGHIVRVEIPVAGIRLMLAALEFNNAAAMINRKQEVSTTLNKEKSMAP